MRYRDKIKIVLAGAVSLSDIGHQFEAKYILHKNKYLKHFNAIMIQIEITNTRVCKKNKNLNLTDGSMISSQAMHKISNKSTQVDLI